MIARLDPVPNKFIQREKQRRLAIGKLVDDVAEDWLGVQGHAHSHPDKDPEFDAWAKWKFYHSRLPESDYQFYYDLLIEQIENSL